MTDAKIIRTIAEKVMGWMPVHERYAPHCGCSMVYDQREETLGKRFIGPACGITLHVEHDRWNPLTSISDAFMVVEKMREKIAYQTKTQTFSFQLCQTGIPGKWFCSFVTNSGDWSTQARIDDADNPARAICLAAIAAIADQKEHK